MTSSQSKSNPSTPNKKVVEEREVPLYQDPFHPVLLNSPSLHITPEQDFFVKEVLDVCCSDSAFAKKAYLALKFILSQEEAPVVLPAPIITSLTPATAVQGDALSVVVAGSGFVDGAFVRGDGAPQTTTFVSDIELSFIPITATVLVQDVYVENPDMQTSNHLTFDVTAPVVQTASTEKSEAYKAEVKEFEAKKDKK